MRNVQENLKAHYQVCNKAVMIRKGRQSDEMGQSSAFVQLHRIQRPATQSDNATSAWEEDYSDRQKGNTAKKSKREKRKK